MGIPSRDLPAHVRARINATKQPGRIFLGDHDSVPAESVVEITLPLPSKSLSPNARVHYLTLAWAKKKAMAHAWAATVHATGATHQRWARATLQATFYHAQNRTRDDDNLNASLKAYRDGIAAAGLVLNDSGFTQLPPRQLIDRDNPRVVLTVTRTDAKEAKDGNDPAK